MVDFVLGWAARGWRGDISRASKGGVAIATSTLEAACSPPLTPLRRDFTCRSRLPGWPQQSGASAEAFRQRDDHPRGRPDPVGAAQRPPVPGVGGLPPRAPVHRPLASRVRDCRRQRGCGPTSRMVRIGRRPYASRRRSGPCYARTDPGCRTTIRQRRLRTATAAAPKSYCVCGAVACSDPDRQEGLNWHIAVVELKRRLSLVSGTRSQAFLVCGRSVPTTGHTHLAATALS